MHRLSPSRRLLLLLTAITLLASCRSPQVSSPEIVVTVNAEGQTRQVTLPAGSTVQQAFQAVGLAVDTLDKTEPPVYTVLNNGDSVSLTRVKETFETEEQVIPFEQIGRASCRERV